MNARIPILYDRALRPEWIDFALEQSMKVEDDGALRQRLNEYLKPQIVSAETLEMTARQLERTVGFRSAIPRERLRIVYEQMSVLSPDRRAPLRLQLLVEANAFFGDCVSTIHKLDALGVKGIRLQQITERIVAKYGDRGMVPRRVCYVLQTLALLGVVTNRDHQWFLAT